MDSEPADQVTQPPKYSTRIKALQAKIADLEARSEWYQELMGPLNFDNKRQAYIRELDSIRETQRQAEPIDKQLDAATRWLKACEQKHERKAAYDEKKRKDRLDLVEAHNIALQERDAELVDLDAAAREWATKLAKAK